MKLFTKNAALNFDVIVVGSWSEFTGFPVFVGARAVEVAVCAGGRGLRWNQDSLTPILDVSSIHFVSRSRIRLLGT